ncbi:MAG: nitronate monooxygenase [Dehalococcoidia bacterium]|nr:nitronate monooxygenase [Dehalococcoidia bacterium]
MLRTAICDLLGIRYPVIQGGMAHIATAELVSAVSNAGGLGIIGCGYYQAEWVRRQIRLTKQKTTLPFGINVPLTSPYVKDVIEVILEEGVPIITTGTASPKPYMARFKAAGMKVIPVIGNVSAAKHVEEAGADAVVAEGMESGGHIGEVTTMALVPQVVDAVKIPVIAAGGMADGRGLAAALALGAQGIQMGTRFVASTECVAHEKYKLKIIEADDRATTVTGYMTGLPLRALKNSLTEQYHALEQAGVSKEELDLLGQGKMHLGLIEGDTEEGSLLAGQIAGMIRDIKPVKAIIEDTVSEAERIIASLNRFTRG